MIRVPETKPEVSFVRHAGQFACGKGKVTHRHALPNIRSSRSVTMRVEISTTESSGLGPPLAVRLHGNHRRLREQRSIETSDGKNVFCSMPWLLYPIEPPRSWQHRFRSCSPVRGTCS